MGEIGWAQERQAAKRLIESLDLEKNLQHAKRRWILRKWPEAKDKEAKKVLESSEKCIPELFLRNQENLTRIKALVKRSLQPLEVNEISTVCGTLEDLQNGNSTTKMSLGALDSEVVLQRDDICIQTNGVYTEQADNLECEAPVIKKKRKSKAKSIGQPPQHILDFRKYEDIEIVKSLPQVLENLSVPALQSILSTLTSATITSKDRNWIQNSIKQVIAAHLEKCDGNVPEVVSIAIEIMRDRSSSRRRRFTKGIGIFSDLPLSPGAAVQSVLDQVEVFPLQTLYAMYDLMCSKPPEYHIARPPRFDSGATKASLADSLRKKAKRLMEYVDEDDPLPDPLKNAMYAISLSAKELEGNDGNLGKFLGPPLPDVEAVHTKVLSAISQLKELGFESLVSLCSLVGHTPDRSYQLRNPVYLRKHFRHVLLNFLLWCTDTKIPAPIQKLIGSIAVVEKLELKSQTIIHKTLQKKKTRKVRGMWPHERREGPEIEALLQVSSHLEQISRDKEEIKKRMARLNEKELEVIEEVGIQSSDRGSNLGFKLGEARNGEILEAAHEAGEICYQILGAALGEISSLHNIRFPTCVQKYLYNSVEDIAGQGDLLSETLEPSKSCDEVALILRIAESLPHMTSRAVLNVKSRLGLC